MNEAAAQQSAFQGRELLASRVFAINLRDVRELNGVRHDLVRAHLLSHRYTSSANESRRRSNRKYPTRNTPIDPAPRARSHFQCPGGPPAAAASAGKNRIS